MRATGAAEPLEGVVLRRRSYLVLYWGGTIGACATAVSVVAFTSVKDEGGGPVLAVASCLGFIVMSRRFFGTRVVLGASSLWVVDPLKVRCIPYGAIHAVGCDEGGALTIELADGEELRPVAFHGSVIDGFVGTSERAAREVKRRLGTSSEGKGASEVRTRLRWDWISDVSAVAALVGTAIALFIGV